MRFITSLVLLLILSATSNSLKWDNVKSSSKEGDVYRSVRFTELEILNGCPSFSSFGVSINGSILEDLNVDTSVFKFTTCNLLKTSFPSYFFRFFSFSKDDGDDDSGSASTSVSGSESQNNDDGTGVKASKIASSFTPTFIIEYLENGDNDGFQYGEDEILSYVNLAKLEYTMTKDETEMKGENNKNFTAYQVQVSSTGSFKDLFQMSFYVSGAPIMVGDVKLSAEQSKVDITINKFYDASVNKKDCPAIQIGNYSCTSSGPSNNNQSRLALTSFFATKSKSLDVDIDDNKIEIDDAVIDAGFSWKGNVEATIEGSKSTVKIVSNSESYVDFEDFGASFIKRSFIGEFSAQFLTFSFDAVRPDTVVWDPKIGGAAEDFDDEDDEDTNSSSQLIASLSIVLISIILSLLV